MEKVNLRSYIREIEKMIEGGRLEEAIAHCQHILKTYPMNIETYRLLGKAYLETRRYPEAADVFQRVLNVVPDDFVSHVGLSIISDDEARLDDAIWHMEHAFEIQPSNSAIQSELKRLYGKRDGVEPTKIRLSRDALANMYSQGELFNQAISEIHAILEQDPNRPDLQVMLMRVYYRSGQKVDAVETAKDLLKKIPNCMDALRVLVDVLPTIGQSENIYAYRQQLALLDPYSAYTSDSVFASNLVVDSAVTLDRLDYPSATIPSSSHLDGEASLETGDADKFADLPPEWMQSPETGDLVSSSIPILSESSAVLENAARETAPLQSQPITGKDEIDLPPAGMENIVEGLPEKSVEKNTFPDWLYPLTSAEVNEQAEPEPETPPLAASIASSTESPEMSASMEIIHEEHVEFQDSGETVATVGKDVPESLITTASAVIPNSEYIEPLQPAEDQPVGEEIIPKDYESNPTEAIQEADFDLQKPDVRQTAQEENYPNWLPPIASEGTPINPNIEPGSGSTNIPANGSEPELLPQEKKPVDEAAFPDWLRAIGAGVAGVIAADSAISDTQPIARSQSVPGQQRFEKTESLVNDNQEPNKPPELTPSDSGEYFQPVEESKLHDLEGKSLGVLESMADQEDVISEALLGIPQGVSTGESTEIIQPVRQAEETLISPVQESIRSPEDISTFEPASLSEVSSTIPDQPVTEVSPTSEEAQYSVATADTTIKPEVQPVREEDATMAWLENLSTDQGTGYSESLEGPADSPALVHDQGQELPDEHPEVPVLEEDVPPMPESIGDTNAKTISLSVDNEPLEKTEEDREPGLNWRYELVNEKPAVQMPEGVVTTYPEIVGDEKNAVISPMVNNLDVGDEQGNRAIESAGNEQPAESIEELPDWLKDLEKPSTPIASSKANDDFFAWLHNPTRGPKSELTSESEEPAWLDENAPIAERTVPTMPGEWVPVETKPAASPESNSIQEPITAEDKTLIVEAEVTEEIPATIGQTQVAGTEQTVEPLQDVDSLGREEFPAFLEQHQVTGAEQIVEPPPVVEPVAPEEIPAFLEPIQVVIPEQTVEPPPVVEPVAPEEIPAFLEPTQVVESEQIVEAPRVIEPVVSEEIPAFLEPTQVIEPEQTVEHPQVVEPLAPEELPSFLEPTQVVESEQTVEQPQLVEPVAPEEIPAFLEQTQVVEPEQTVEPPQVVEPVVSEETPAVLEQTQVVESEQTVEHPQVVEPVAPEEIPAFLEPTQVVESEQTVEQPQLVEPVAPEEIPAFLEPTQVVEPEQTVEPPPVVEPVAPEATPVVIEQTQVVEPKQIVESPRVVEPVMIPPVTPLQPPAIKQEGMLSPVPFEDRDAELLISAQSVLDQQSLDEAMKRYTHLIRKGRLLPEVIHDLQEAGSRFPMNMNVWQTLGDAYMRANLLQDALDAYTKAEELLR